MKTPFSFRRILTALLGAIAALSAFAVAQVPATNEQDAAQALQIWIRSEDLKLENGQAVSTWPDRSGHGRDLSATSHAIAGGVGLAGRFLKESTIQGRPAVHFDDSTGLGARPGNPVPITGNAEMTFVLVMNLQPGTDTQPLDCIFGIGEPANPNQDPGKPLAAFVSINRRDDHALLFAGGWYHDASAGSFSSLYGRPVILTIVKRPGPMRTTTRFYINGEISEVPVAGKDTVPDIRHRPDMGAFMGKAMAWAGSIRGDIGEVLLYSKALSDGERQAVEKRLSEKFAIHLGPPTPPPRATFTPEEKALWAYQPIKDPPIPVVKDAAWCKSPIDNFIRARQEAQGLSPAPPADKPTLIRRVTFDLIGLPPTPGEIEDFVADPAPDAFDRVVTRLLDSPRYGEHWGRHWLDIARYADTTANDANAVMHNAWRYRNYVIDAFNRDLPYDQFLIEQLAGDLLPQTQDAAERARRIIATGFLMVGPKALAETDKEQTRLDIVDDQIDVLGRGVLGLTIACARCHDHKFDAIRTADYYALAGIFRSTEPFQNEERNASMWWEFPVVQALGSPPIMVMAPKEGTPRDLRVHLRGNRFNLGLVAPRGFPQVLAPRAPVIAPGSSGRLELARWVASRENPLTARVIANRVWQHHIDRGLVATSDNFGVRGEKPSHPELLDWLATRLMDSGWSLKSLHRQIVLSNTYRQQCRPSEMASNIDGENRLLSHFPRRRLSAEQLRDAILSISGKLDLTADQGESSEALWQRAEKPDAKGDVRPNRMAADDPYYTQYTRRSIYMPVVRNSIPDVLALFDAADPNSVAGIRNDTTVPTQSLFLMNSPFARQQARNFAARLLAEKGDDLQHIARAHDLALGRPPRADEIAEARAYIEAYLNATAAQARPAADRQLAAWQSYCQTLFCQNEFLYCD